jgi:hypothetical protein
MLDGFAHPTFTSDMSSIRQFECGSTMKAVSNDGPTTDDIDLERTGKPHA